MMFSIFSIDSSAVNSGSGASMDVKKNTSKTRKKLTRFKVLKKLGFLTQKKNPKKQKETYPLAKLSAFLGLLGAVIPVLGALLGVLAIIMGFMALSRIKKSGGKYRGKRLVIIGIALGIISILGALVIYTFAMSGISGFGSNCFGC